MVFSTPLPVDQMTYKLGEYKMNAYVKVREPSVYRQKKSLIFSSQYPRPE